MMVTPKEGNQDRVRRECKYILATCAIERRIPQQTINSTSVVGTGSLVRDFFPKCVTKVHLITSEKIIPFDADLRDYFLRFKKATNKDKKPGVPLSEVSKEVMIKSPGLAVIPLDSNKFGCIRKKRSGLLNHRPFTIYSEELNRDGSELICYVVHTSGKSFDIVPLKVRITDEETYLTDLNSSKINADGCFYAGSGWGGFGAPITMKHGKETVAVGAITYDNNKQILPVLFSEIDRERIASDERVAEDGEEEQPADEQVEGREEQPSDEQVEGREEQPSDEQVEGREEQPSDEQVEEREEQPSDEQVEGREEQPSDEQVEGREEQPSDQQVEGREEQPSDEQVEGREEQPSDERVEGREEQPSDEQVEGREEQPSDEQVEGREEQPSDERVEGGEEQPSDEQVEGREEQPSDQQVEDVDGGNTKRTILDFEMEENTWKLSCKPAKGKIPVGFKVLQDEKSYDTDVEVKFKDAGQQAGQDVGGQQNSNPQQDPFFGGTGENSSSFLPGSSLGSVADNNGSRRHGAGNHTNNREKCKSDSVNKDNDDCVTFTSSYNEGATKEDTLKHSADQHTSAEDCVTFTSSYSEGATKEDTLKHSADQHTSAEVSRCKFMAPWDYTEEQINYFRLCHVVTDVITEGLRKIFKREWDNRYKVTLGEWKDTPKNGQDFWNGESLRRRSTSAHLLATMRNGDTAEWDCTMLIYAILFSDCIYGLALTVKSNVDILRRVRNEEFAHLTHGSLTSGEFQSTISKIKTAFLALSLPTQKIHEIRTQSSFPTEELRNVLKKVDCLKQEIEVKEAKLYEIGKELVEKETKLEENEKELEVKENLRQTLEEQLGTEVYPFCVLPPKPSHDVSPRRSEVDEITQQLKVLKDANKDSLSTLYLSGNPGSGKSLLARLVAKRLLIETRETPSAISFVMTLNAESSGTLVESYICFARHCKCPEYAVTDTYSSKDLSIDEKIASFKTLISAKIGLYTSWLLVVDNVNSLSHVHAYLPDPGNQQWTGGQLLITTQDTKSIPLASSSIQHISVSKGMLPDDASSLLRLLSGVTDDKMEKEIAQYLDYQPLALASAACYLREVRRRKIASNFGWTDYLKKLEEGHRHKTEIVLVETNLLYLKSMTAATTLALQKAMSSDRVIDHLFTFLSFCAPQPVLKDIVIDYIVEMEKEFEDEVSVGVKVSRCPLLLFDEEESGVYLRIHRVVHQSASSVAKSFSKETFIKSAFEAVKSFSKDKILDSPALCAKIVPHLAKVITDIEHQLFKEGTSEVDSIHLSFFQDSFDVLKSLGIVCLNHCEFHAAKSYFEVALKITQKSDPCIESQKQDVYTYLGLAYSQLDDLQHAKNCHERVLEIRLEKLGLKHVDVARSYKNLGYVHSQLGDLEHAKDCYKRALEILLEQFGTNHIDVATAYNNLGCVQSQLGDLKRAKECHKHAQEIRLRALGPEHVDVATSFKYLRDVQDALDQIEGTES